MIVLVTDPITNAIVSKPQEHPYIIHGEGRNITKIYFECQENKEKYMKQYSISNVVTA